MSNAIFAVWVKQENYHELTFPLYEYIIENIKDTMAVTKVEIYSTHTRCVPVGEGLSCHVFISHARSFLCRVVLVLRAFHIF